MDRKDKSTAQGWLEKRIHQRVAVRLPVVYRSLDEKKVDQKIKDHIYRDASTFSENISAGGMLLSLKEPLPIGTMLEMEITLSPQDKPLKAMVCLVRQEKDEKTGAYLSGFQFVGIHRQDTERISNFVQKIMSLK